jgi:hypothetical protein
MAILHSVVRFAFDGTIAAATPVTPVIVPGIDALWQCESECADGSEINLTDLTAARLIWLLTSPGGQIVMWYEDAPFFAITDARHGLFTVSLLAGRTDLLTAGTYTLEIKASYPDGSAARIAATPLTVVTSALAGQP